MSSTFSHTPSGVSIGTSRTLVYGPVPAGTTAIIFSGTLSNIDSVGQAQHTATLESYDSVNYTTHLPAIPIPYGSASEVPKIVLLAGESLYCTADATSSIACRLEILLRT